MLGSDAGTTVKYPSGRRLRAFALMQTAGVQTVMRPVLGAITLVGLWKGIEV
jgi:hypothetical protein